MNPANMGESPQSSRPLYLWHGAPGDRGSKPSWRSITAANVYSAGTRHHHHWGCQGEDPKAWARPRGHSQLSNPEIWDIPERDRGQTHTERGLWDGTRDGTRGTAKQLLDEDLQAWHQIPVVASHPGQEHFCSGDRQKSYPLLHPRYCLQGDQKEDPRHETLEHGHSPRAGPWCPRHSTDLWQEHQDQWGQPDKWAQHPERAGARKMPSLQQARTRHQGLLFRGGNQDEVWH